VESSNPILGTAGLRSVAACRRVRTVIYAPAVASRKICRRTRPAATTRSVRRIQIIFCNGEERSAHDLPPRRRSTARKQSAAELGCAVTSTARYRCRSIARDVPRRGPRCDEPRGSGTTRSFVHVQVSSSSHRWESWPASRKFDVEGPADADPPTTFGLFYRRAVNDLNGPAALQPTALNCGPPAYENWAPNRASNYDPDGPQQ
jgi:hypothetical protein